MGDSEQYHPPLKAFELSQGVVLERVAGAFSAEFRRGYFLREILRTGDKFVCIWARTLDSYASDFDWCYRDHAEPRGDE